MASKAPAAIGERAAGPARGPGRMEGAIPVAVVITRLVRGGAQRIALEGVAGLPRRFRPTLITGPECGAEGSLAEEARERGVELVTVPSLGREISPLRDWRALRELAAMFRRGGHRIVHPHTSKAGLLAAMAARRAGVPVVVYSPHGHIFGRRAQVPGVSGAGRLKRRVLLGLRRHAERLADRVVALGERDRDEQVELGLAPRGKYVVLRNGIDLERFRPLPGGAREAVRAELGTPPHALVIATVGRLSPEKGHDTLLEALAALEAAGDSGGRDSGAGPGGAAPGAAPPELWVIGDGARRDDLERRARGLARTRVRFLGMRDDVPRLVGAADLMALPSRYESQGLVFLEAMATGVPVVGPRVGGVPEVVQDGETGLLVPPDDPAALARAIGRLIADPLLRERLARRGGEVVRERYGLERMVGQLAELYDDLLAMHAPGN